MNPAWSMIFFTTLAGAGQGLLLTLVGVDLAAHLGLVATPDRLLYLAGAAIVLFVCGIGLGAATFHLGHPMRAWRSMAQWRTSWLSREIVVLPAFMASVLAWGGAHFYGAPTLVLGGIGAVLALLLYLCTGMIYAAVSVIREWATALTPLNFALLGIASGLTAAALLSSLVAPDLTGMLAGLALVATLVAGVARGASFWRNSTLAPRTTLQSAIGVRHPKIRQASQGAMGGSFNTREFFHGALAATLPRLRWVVLIAVFVLPAMCLSSVFVAASVAASAAALVIQYLGLLAERWLFFAEGQHPQNLYYQRVG